MKIYFIFIGTVLAGYFIGLVVGLIIGSRMFKNQCSECQKIFIDVDPEEIQHVGYTAEQCGYDK